MARTVKGIQPLLSPPSPNAPARTSGSSGSSEWAGPSAGVCTPGIGRHVLCVGEREGAGVRQKLQCRPACDTRVPSAKSRTGLQVSADLRDQAISQGTLDPQRKRDWKWGQWMWVRGWARAKEISPSDHALSLTFCHTGQLQAKLRKEEACGR